MRNAIIIVFFLLVSSWRVSAETSDAAPDDAAYVRLQQLSAMNLNVGASFNTDSLLWLSRKVEAAARAAGSVSREFKAGQILVNAYGLAGNLALAASKAQELLDKAGREENPLAMGLAIQAIGDTYLVAGRFVQADSLFAKAEPSIIQYGDCFMQAELLLQEIHVHLSHDSFEAAVPEIERLHTLLDTTAGNLPAVESYRFLLRSYEVLLAIRLRDTARAGALLAGIRTSGALQEGFRMWVYYLESQYRLLTEDYGAALQYNDSTLSIAQGGTNGDILFETLMSKASLLEKTGRNREASELYREILRITDSLYQARYTVQIDSLHATYWTDQVQMANINRRNLLYAWIAGGLFFLVAVTLVVVLLVRRKNRQLIRSRQELEAARAASDDSLRTKSLFLSNMSHELRTPLNGIVGFSAILTDEESIDEQTRQQCCEYIRENADLLLKLINDVVDLSELKDQSIRFTYASCDVVALSRGVLKTVENVKRTRAEVRFVSDVEKLELMTDRNRLQQVLINLLINATKFTPQGSITLSLHLDEQAGEAVFSVEDTGCGIPLEKQPYIFERYEKLHEGVQGAGLGLSICQLIVQHGRGRIWIDSSYTQGARFVFTHPLNLKPEQS